jgi:hypothetical protein
MSTLQQQITEKFLSKLGGSGEVDPDKIEKLRALLSENKKAKAEDFMKIFTEPTSEDLK